MENNENLYVSDYEVIEFFLDLFPEYGIIPTNVISTSPLENNFNELLSYINSLKPRIDYILSRHPFLNSLLLQLATDISNKINELNIITEDEIIKNTYKSIMTTSFKMVLQDMILETLKYGNSFAYLKFDNNKFSGLIPINNITKNADGNYVWENKIIDVNHILHLSFLKLTPFTSVGVPVYFTALTTAERAAMLEDLYILLRLLRGIPIKKIILNLKKNYSVQEVQMLKARIKEKLYYNAILDNNGQINIFNVLKAFETVFIEMQMDGQKIVDFEILELKGVDSIQDDEILTLMYNKLYSVIPIPSYYKDLVFKNTRLSKVVEGAGGEYSNKLAVEKQDYAYNRFLETIFYNITTNIIKTIVVALIHTNYYNFEFEIKSHIPTVITLLNIMENITTVNNFINTLLSFNNSINELNKLSDNYKLIIDYDKWFQDLEKLLENTNIKLQFINEKTAHTPETKEDQTTSIFESKKILKITNGTNKIPTEENNIKSNDIIKYLINNGEIKL